MSNTKKKNLCQSHINQLQKVADHLQVRLKMNGTQIIFGDTNLRIINTAERLIREAINELKNVS